MKGYIVMKKLPQDGIVVDQPSYQVIPDELTALIAAMRIDEQEGPLGATGIVIPVHVLSSENEA